VAYADRIHHGVPSSAKPSDMDSIGQQLKMTRWRTSPSARIANSFRSRIQSMSILFDLSISLGRSQYGKSILWVSCLGHQRDSDSYSSLSTHSQSGWKLCSSEHHPGSSGQVPIEYHLQIWCSKVGLNR
jgi:hypothetical protein